MNRKRSTSKRGFPANLYMNPDGYFYYRNPVNKKRKGIGHDKAHAFREARQANAALAAVEKSSLTQWVKGIEEMSLERWIPIYKKLWIEKRKPAPSTVEGALRYLERFSKADFAWRPMSEITTVHISKYLDDLAENSGIASAKNMRARLMDIFGFAITKGYIEPGKNPVAATISPDYESKRDRLSLEQFLLIREKARPWLRNAMNLALLTGQRVGDIGNMRFADVKDGYLHIEQKKSQGKIKLKLDLTIGLTAIDMSIGDVIKQCRDHVLSKYLIHQTRTSGVYKAGDGFAYKGISKAFTDIRDALNIGVTSKDKTPPTFHEIRSLSERLYRKEKGKEFAQTLLGHKTESMSAKYDDLRGSDFQAVTAK